MYHPDPDYEYREKWGRLGMEVEMLILDIIHLAVERLNMRNETVRNKENQEEMEPF